MVEAQAAEFMRFCASEFHTFFGHLGNSISTFQSTGKVPTSIFKSSGHSGSAGASKADKPKSKRRPTAFNMFVKHKMEELKQKGVHLDGDKNNNGMFTLAVSEWKNLSEQAKADYTAKFKAELQEASGELQDGELGVDLADVPSPKAPAAAPQEVQKVKKKRKKTENIEAPAADAEAKSAAAATEPAAAAAVDEAPEGSEKKHKKHKKDKSHKKDKLHKRERREAAE